MFQGTQFLKRGLGGDAAWELLMGRKCLRHREHVLVSMEDAVSSHLAYDARNPTDERAISTSA